SPIAETTTTTLWPSLRVATIRSATRLIRSASATDEPPYFCTTSPTTAPSERVTAHGQGTGRRDPAFPMRFPRSSSGGGKSCGGSVELGVVGGAVLPAAPDDADPGAGEDAYGVWVAFAAVDGVVVDLGGPGAGVAGIVGEVDQGVAELLVGGP